jgi:MFS family permease
MFSGWIAGGFVSAFLIIYLHFVRHVSLGTAGVALALVALGGSLVSPFVGSLTDRFGARRLLAIMLAIGAIGAVSLAAVRTPWQAMMATFVYGVGLAGLSGPEYTLLATVVPKAKRSAAFALQYSALSLGISIGALLGGLVVDIKRPVTFELVFLACAVPYAVYGLLLRRVSVLPGATTETAEPSEAGSVADRPSGGYRRVLADRVFLRLLAAMLLVIVFSGTQLDAAYPAFAVGVGGASTRLVGYAFMANSLMIVISQLFVLRLLEGHRRTRAFFLATGFAVLCWIMVLVSVHLGGGSVAMVGFVAALMVFAIAEVMWAPTYMPLVNDLAPDELRGRYNALDGTIDGVARVLGPLLAGYLLQFGLGDLLMIVLAAGTAASALTFVGIERRLPAEANLISGPEPSDQAV